MTSQVTAAAIIPECRATHGDAGAWALAIQRLEANYKAICTGWADQPRQPTLSVRLMIDRPT